jgi:DNA polymerase-1
MPAGQKAEPSVPSVSAATAESFVAPPISLPFSSDLVAARKKEYGLIGSAAGLKKALAAIPEGNMIAIDTETTGLRIREDELVGFSFCGDGAHAYYVPLAHAAAEGGFPTAGQMPKAEAMKIFGEFLKGRKVSGQNLKFDVNILRRAGVSFTADQIGFDTMIASYVLEPEARHGLDLLASKHLGHKNISYEELCGEGKKQITFAQVPLEQAKDYAAEDAHVAYLLAELLQERLSACPELEKVFREIDLPLVTVLADLEWEGVAIDTAHLKKVSADFSLELARLEKRAHELAGGEFNLSSPKQLQKILFEDLKLPTSKKTKTGFSGRSRTFTATLSDPGARRSSSPIQVRYSMFSGNALNP